MPVKSDHFGTIHIGIVAGGDDNDPAKDHSCNMKVFLPMEHNPEGVKPEHLAFSPMMHSPTKHSQTSFPGVLDPGTLVYVLKRPGDNQCIILGQANDLLNNDVRTPGNRDLLQGFVQSLFDKTIKVKPPPDVEEAEERGAKIRKIKEKEDYWAHSMTQGLPTHGAMFSIAGFRLPELKDIPTAKQEYQKVMTEDMAKNLPGTMMSLGKLMKNIMGNKKNRNAALAGMNPQMQNAVRSVAGLTQSMESSNYGSFIVSATVEANTYTNNAISLINQCTCVDDLMTVLNRLQYDTSLFGWDKLNCVSTNITTAWGPATQLICANGNVNIIYANTQPQQQQSDFQNSMNSPASAPGVTQDNNMFGKSANTMMQLLKRVAPEGEKKGKELSQKLNQDSIAQKLNEIVKKTIKGGNPLDPSLFK